jgi:hypothetical protein
MRKRGHASSFLDTPLEDHRAEDQAFEVLAVGGPRFPLSRGNVGHDLVTYERLAIRLREMGQDETKVSVANKLSRGTFSATFFVAVMKAIGREQVDLADV